MKGRRIMKAEADDLQVYLKRSHYVDYDNAGIQELAKALTGNRLAETEVIKTIYEYVRDEIGHSWDICRKKVTVTASEVLENRHGICYSKANLLAALLRSRGIPAGFCYQKLILGDTPDTGYCIHALNAVYIEEMKKWVRLDARGNKPGVDARFSPEEERLAFPVRREYGEIDYEVIYAKPLEITMKTLESNTDAVEMCRHFLPAEL